MSLTIERNLGDRLGDHLNGELVEVPGVDAHGILM
jgi:hypothetical protein